MTAALEGGGWSSARPGRTLRPGKTRYPFYRRVGGPQGRSGRAENLVPAGIRSRIVQPVVSRYTDWATRPTDARNYKYKIYRPDYQSSESRWGRDFPPVHTDPGAQPVSCKMGTRSFPEVKCGRCVLLTTHPLLVTQSWKSRATPLPTLWATPGL